MVTTETVNRPRRPLYVSAVVGGDGPGNARVDARISNLARVVREQEEALPAAVDAEQGAAVDATFHVPGPLVRPDYEGIRTGRWVEAKRLLVVQIAVPEGLSTADDADAFLSGALVDAVEVAAEYLSRKKPKLRVDRARVIAERAAAVLS